MKSISKSNAKLLSRALYKYTKGLKTGRIEFHPDKKEKNKIILTDRLAHIRKYLMAKDRKPKQISNTDAILVRRAILYYGRQFSFYSNKSKEKERIKIIHKLMKVFEYFGIGRFGNSCGSYQRIHKITYLYPERDQNDEIEMTEYSDFFRVTYDSKYIIEELYKGRWKYDPEVVVTDSTIVGFG